VATPFVVELVTPERVLFSGEVEEVSLRTDEGEIAFLAHHEDFIGALDITVCKLTPASGGEDTQPVLAAIHGGFVHVDDSGVKLLAGVAELGSEIDVARARAALTAAESQVPGEPAASHGDELAADGEGAIARSPAMLALLEPEAPAQVARRARVRLEAAGETLGN
jgi:F-type H+-transporting ATPase subunit epsilon